MKIIPIEKEWNRIRDHFRRSRKANSHFVLSIVDDQGFPRTMPIGSLMLNRDQTGYFFEKFTSSFSRFGAPGQQICVLAVNSNRWFWLRSIFQGRFSRPPAIRLYGRLGELREGTPAERDRFQRLVKPVRGTKGHRLMWEDMSRVRELTFERAEGANLGKMTEALWKDFGVKTAEKVLL